MDYEKKLNIYKKTIDDLENKLKLQKQIFVETIDIIIENISEFVSLDDYYDIIGLYRLDHIPHLLCYEIRVENNNNNIDDDDDEDEDQQNVIPMKVFAEKCILQAKVPNSKLIQKLFKETIEMEYKNKIIIQDFNFIENIFQKNKPYPILSDNIMKFHLRIIINSQIVDNLMFR